MFFFCPSGAGCQVPGLFQHVSVLDPCCFFVFGYHNCNMQCHSKRLPIYLLYCYNFASVAISIILCMVHDWFHWILIYKWPLNLTVIISLIFKCYPFGEGYYCCIAFWISACWPNPKVSCILLGICDCRTTVFSHSQTVVVCPGCQTVLCQPTGGKARLTEGCSFRRKGD